MRSNDERQALHRVMTNIAGARDGIDFATLIFHFLIFFGLHLNYPMARVPVPCRSVNVRLDCHSTSFHTYTATAHPTSFYLCVLFFLCAILYTVQTARYQMTAHCFLARLFTRMSRTFHISYRIAISIQRTCTSILSIV